MVFLFDDCKEILGQGPRYRLVRSSCARMACEMTEEADVIDLERLSHALVSYKPLDLSGRLSSFAAVAVLIRVSDDGRVWIGFIRRAIHDGDRWSGQIAFPGGKHEPSDSTSLDTAIRETSEEIGVRLRPDVHIGRLDDIQARGQGGMLPFYIRPHVFVLRENPALKLDASEVAAFEWVNFEWLIDADNKRVHTFMTQQGEFESPAVLMPDGSVLWGLTLRITEMLIAISVPSRTMV